MFDSKLHCQIFKEITFEGENKFMKWESFSRILHTKMQNDEIFHCSFE